ncbi:hypothetical protein FQR65_LT17608 [Abscondita terminalis]|nr:hypothetical protein FQR65_LT17608 [Abscondita terminalis]
MDLKIRAISKSKNLKLAIVDITEGLKEIVKLQNTNPIATVALGKILMNTALISLTLKDGSKISSVINGGGPIGTLIAEFEEDKFRGYVDKPNFETKDLQIGGGLSPLAQSVGVKGFLQITRDLNQKEPYTSRVDLISGEINLDFIYFLQQSDQVQSFITSSVKMDDEMNIEKACGIIIQLLPDATEDDIDFLEEKIGSIEHMNNTLQKTTNYSALLTDIVEDAKILDSGELKFECTCNIDKVKQSVKLLGKEQHSQILELNEAVEVIYGEIMEENKNKSDIKITPLEEPNKKVKEVSDKKSNIIDLSVETEREYRVVEFPNITDETVKGVKAKSDIVSVTNNKPDLNKYVIELFKVKKSYINAEVVTPILKGVDLKLKKADFVVILGPSGSGKTTLLNTISGLDNKCEGDVFVNGANLALLKDSHLTRFRRDYVGFIFQQYNLLTNLTAKENAEVGENLARSKNKDMKIEDIFETIGMTEQMNKYPHQMSGGQQQRVSIARALAKNPNILFCDEPTGALDEEMGRKVLDILVEVNKKYKTTVIMVTHNPNIATIASVVIHVKNGLIDSIKENANPKKPSEID